MPTPVCVGCWVLKTWGWLGWACIWDGCCLGDVEKLTPEGEDPSFSPVFIRENANRVSGKFGGVAGVLQGVQICPKCAAGLLEHGGTEASSKNMLRAVFQTWNKMSIIEDIA